MLEFAKTLVADAMHLWAQEDNPRRTTVREEWLRERLGVKPTDNVKVLRPSSGGSCLRKQVVMSHVRFPDDKSTNLRQGTEGHKWMDECVDKLIHRFQGKVVRLVPWFVPCYEINGFLVGGTPDHLLYIPEELHLLVIDYKFVADYPFMKVDKEGVSDRYLIQLATYHNGLCKSPFVQSLDPRKPGVYQKVTSTICYFKKSDLSKQKIRLVADENQNAMTTSVKPANYWSNVVSAIEHTEETGELPPPTPMETWECGYCPLQHDCSSLVTLEDLYDFHDKAMALEAD